MWVTTNRNHTPDLAGKWAFAVLSRSVKTPMEIQDKVIHKSTAWDWNSLLFEIWKSDKTRPDTYTKASTFALIGWDLWIRL
ncbi:MAG: hypothetical protein ABJB85_09170 [Nitrososphaerota archaeon]